MYLGSESHPRMKDIVIVYAGTMDLSETGEHDKAEVEWRPQYEVFRKRRAKWLPEFEDTKFDAAAGKA